MGRLGRRLWRASWWCGWAAAQGQALAREVTVEAGRRMGNAAHAKDGSGNDLGVEAGEGTRRRQTLLGRQQRFRLRQRGQRRLIMQPMNRLQIINPEIMVSLFGYGGLCCLAIANQCVGLLAKMPVMLDPCQ